MRIGIISDLHLSHYPPSLQKKILWNIEADIKRGVDLLINAGDTSQGAGVSRDLFNEWLSSFPGINYFEVPGNHDYYHDIMQPFEIEREFNSIRLAGTTLWTDCGNDPIAEMWFMANMNDCNYIRNFSVPLMRHIHNSNREFLERSNAHIYVTHNPPCMMSVGPQYKTQHLANKAFIPDISVVLYEKKPKLYVHGHVHYPFDYLFAETRIVANPLGYPGEIYKSIEEYRVKIIDFDLLTPFIATPIAAEG